MRAKLSRIERKGGRWAVYARKRAECTTDAAWICLGGCGDARIAFRLWLSLQGAGSD